MPKKLFVTLTVILLMTMTVSLVMIANTLIRSNAEIRGFESLAEIVNTPPANTNSQGSEGSDDTDTDTVAESGDVSVIPEQEPVYTRNLAPLYEQNGDCLGWISIPGTSVDYPVMYAPNESQKYLRKDFNGDYSLSGTPFLQENCTPDSDNLIVYGHNMKNGTMFSDIVGYVEPSYREAHPTIEFETPEGLVIYEVISVLQVKSNDPWYSFISAADDDDYTQRLSELTERSLYSIDSEISVGRRLLTLSTCYGKNKDDRLIVIAAECL